GVRRGGRIEPLLLAQRRRRGEKDRLRHLLVARNVHPALLLDTDRSLVEQPEEKVHRRITVLAALEEQIAVDVHAVDAPPAAAPRHLRALEDVHLERVL